MGVLFFFFFSYRNIIFLASSDIFYLSVIEPLIKNKEERERKGYISEWGDHVFTNTDFPSFCKYYLSRKFLGIDWIIMRECIVKKEKGKNKVALSKTEGCVHL